MNKAMAAAVVVLAAAVLLLSGTVFYMSKRGCAGQFGPCGGPGIQMQRPMPYSMNQPRPAPENMPPVFGQPEQSQALPAGHPEQMGGPLMGGGQPGQPQQRGPGMRGGQGMQGRPGMGMQGGQGQQSSPMMGDGMGQQGQQPEPALGGAQGQGQSGLREQISQIMQEASQEAQSYFKSQNRKPEHQEMLAKVKELASQKMSARGISQDIQQKVLGELDKKTPPLQSQPR